MSNYQIASSNVLQSPLELDDDQILENVYKTHFHCVEKCDVQCLHSVASNVIHHSIAITDCLINKGSQQSDQFHEGSSFGCVQQLTAKLKRIACQMLCTGRGDKYAHHTTMLILEQLKAYSWDAKALIVQAAFALEFGKLSHIPQSQSQSQSQGEVVDQLLEVEKSLAELNGLPSLRQKSEELVILNGLVKKVMQMIGCIREWKELISKEYEIKEVPILSQTLHQIPVIVYWTIFTFVTCTAQINYFTTTHHTNRDNRYELPKHFDHRLDGILKSFQENLEDCKKQIEAIEDYTKRKNIIYGGNKDIVRVLRALIISTHQYSDSRQIVYCGLNGQPVKIEDLKKKHVLLFISGLENIQDEIKLLKGIYEKLKEEPREVEGYRKEDFKILWIPIVDEWNERNKKDLEKMLEDTKIGWYVVKDFNFKTGMRLIREVFKYKDKSIIPLLSPQGQVENDDTKLLLSVWGIDGFPFKASDYTRLTQQWNWFWNEITKLNPRMKDFIEDDYYIFIFGGTSSKWIEEFETALNTLKRQIETTVPIELYRLGRDDSRVVPRFWIAIDSLLANRKHTKGGGGEGVMDFSTREMKRLLFLKQDPKGWVILSKGSNVKLLGQGEVMYRTVKEFEKWPRKLDDQEVSFDVAFKEYYERIKLKDGPPKCEHSEITYPSDILARIPCPNVDCGRSMEVTSVNYKCCHGLEQPNVAPRSNLC
ncbi:protein SIEVE ELEMENT OCCLUSION B-like isoform X1 [Arachis duranensis]|uniref:Protein SIEVE ELEMENT OCCLUSION B-like isoform X1 n=1 Tax=Arachis duranensis TaxID=130453 RepID=A0A6P4CX50_ARADU|nr:protein SIEVE ELEMENT OCCLUSION B-like isoform X1 [Arachis duranensis]